MKRAIGVGIAGLSSLALLATCHNGSFDPPPCETVTPVFDAGEPDVVWGFADLHSHPAIEAAFGGRMIWGTALDDAPVNAAELPMIDSCPVETHDRNASSPLDREVGALVFPHVASQANFAHAPVGQLTYRPSHAWPNARDVIHQQMNVSSIRRAYEGGLRLMFASTTHDQVLGALLQGPNALNAYVPDPNSDYESARAQLQLIEQMVEQNKNWMWIANSPQSAREIIASGRLAIVMSLEMNGLSQSQLDSLVHDYDVRHVIPIHLIDNDIGGTAATSNLFNAASSVVSELYRSDHLPEQYENVVATSDYGRDLTRPFEITTLDVPVYAGISDIPYDWYSSLCYEPLSFCSGSAPLPTSFIEFGQQNLRGLCTTATECDAGARPGAARIRHMMDSKLFIDLSHMSARAVNDTLAVDSGSARGYPVMASHGDFVQLVPTDAPGDERSLAGPAARQVIARGGVLGLGSGIGTYGKRTLVEVRGGPLLTMSPSPGANAGCVTKNGADGAPASGCQSIPEVTTEAAGTRLDALRIQTLGGVTGTALNAHPFVRIELDGPVHSKYQRRVFVEPLECSTEACTTTVQLGRVDRSAVATPGGAACTTTPSPSVPAAEDVPFTLKQLESVTLEWLYLGCDLACQEDAGAVGTDQQCGSSWSSGPLWTIDEADLAVVDSKQAPVTIAHVGPRAAVPITTLGQSRGTFTLYARSDAFADPVQASGHLLRVSMTSGSESDLEGASPSSAGANVCIAVRKLVDGECRPTPLPAAGATECPSEWSEMNQRGAWPSGGDLYTFVRFPGAESDVCGVDVAVLDWDPTEPPWTINEVKVETIEDPVAHWIRRYAQVANSVAGGELGRIAFGTDFNGLNGLIDISENGVPDAGAPAASACPVSGTSGASGAGRLPALPLAPMRLRNSDGTLGGEVLLEERGLATYGLLADMLAVIQAFPGCGKDVHDSLMLSAEATLRAWEAILHPNDPLRPLPKRAFDCDAATGDAGSADGGAGQGP